MGGLLLVGIITRGNQGKSRVKLMGEMYYKYEYVELILEEFPDCIQGYAQFDG